jgi:hypothetical protein
MFNFLIHLKPIILDKHLYIFEFFIWIMMEWEFLNFSKYIEIWGQSTWCMKFSNIKQTWLESNHKRRANKKGKMCPPSKCPNVYSFIHTCGSLCYWLKHILNFLCVATYPNIILIKLVFISNTIWNLIALNLIQFNFQQWKLFQLNLNWIPSNLSPIVELNWI